VGGGRRGTPPPGDAVHHGQVWKRARVLGKRGPDLPRPDRARGPGDRDPPRDDPLFHDDSGSGAAGDPGGRSRGGIGRCVRARDGRAGADSRPGAQHDSPRGVRAGAGRRDRDHRAAPRREDPRGAVQCRRALRADRGEQDRARGP
jgi:hypothetical protein